MPIPVVLQMLFALAGRPLPTWVRRFVLPLWVVGTAILATDIGLGIVLGATARERPEGVVALATAIVGSVMAWRMQRGPGFLEVAADVTVGRVVSAIAVHTVLGYLVLVPVAAAAAVGLVCWYGDPRQAQAQWFVVLAALWLPLWWAPAVGPWWAWRRGLAAVEARRASR